MVHQRLGQLRVGWLRVRLGPQPPGLEHGNQAHISRLREVSQGMKPALSSCVLLRKRQEKAHRYRQVCACACKYWPFTNWLKEGGQ